VQVVDTHNNFFSKFIKGIFARCALAGFVGGANYCTTRRNSTSDYLADASDKKDIIYRCKRGLLWDMYRKKARSFVGKSERNGHVRYYEARRSCLSIADTTVMHDISWHDYRVPNHLVIILTLLNVYDKSCCH